MAAKQIPTMEHPLADAGSERRDISKFPTIVSTPDVLTAAGASVLSSTTFASSWKEREPLDQSVLKRKIPAKPSEQDVPQSAQGLRALMRGGAWKAALRLSQTLLSATEKAHPHVEVQFKLARIVSYMKLRLYKNAAEELAAMGNLNEIIYQFENYPNFYGKGMRGSFVPFSLLVLHSELTFLTSGNAQQTLNLLYNLLNVCKDGIAEAAIQAGQVPEAMKEEESGGDETFSLERLKKKLLALNIQQLDSLFTPSLPLLPGSIDQDLDEITAVEFLSEEWSILPEAGAYKLSIERWRYRYNWVILLIIKHQLLQKEYGYVQGLIHQLLETYLDDPVLLSCLGRFYVHIGSFSIARKVFDVVATFRTKSKHAEVLHHMNLGILYMSQENYNDSILEFDHVLKVDRKNVAATNNKAVALLYTCKLTDAIHVLEDLILSDPANNLRETVVFNLCSLYDLKSDDSNEKKAIILKLVQQFANDGFDHSALKLSVSTPLAK